MSPLDDPQNHATRFSGVVGTRVDGPTEAVLDRLGSPAKAVSRRMHHRWQDFGWVLLYMSPALALFLGGANSSSRDAAFVSGETVITFNSIAALRGYISSVQQAGGKVDVRAAYIPRPPGAKGGVIMSGASLWITNTGTPEQQAGARDFVKFAAQPAVQAFWSSNTGYYPIRKAAYNMQEMQEALHKYPPFKVAIEQLRTTEPSPATAGAVFGTFTPARDAMQAAMEQFMRGKIASAKAALDQAASQANDKLEEYNSTVK
jgi:sn-glycerol 3-phosphate transport system substrate-binding protein